MAYGVKYRLGFADNTGIAWQADIYQDGYVGSVIEVIGTGDPIHIKLTPFDDVFEPICSSNATINLISETTDQFIEFQTADIYEYYIDIKRGGATHWKGVYVTEPFVEEFTSAPYPIQLIFNDGLAELQYERYDNSGTLRGSFETCITIITKCFSFLPFARKTRELVNMFDDNMDDTDTEGLLEQLVVFEQAFWEKDDSDDNIKGEHCLEVIRGIMSSLKCRIVVSQDIWYIIRIGEMFDTSIKFVEYNTSGVVTGNSTIDLRRPIDKTAAMDTLLRHLAGGNNSISKEYQEIEFTYTSKNITTWDNNVILNWLFTKGYELQNGSPVPKYWTRSAAINTVLAGHPTALHLEPQEPGDDMFGPKATANLYMEDTLLLNTKITAGPSYDPITGVFIPNDAAAIARETYNLFSECPADATITYKNLLHSTSDHLELRIKGWLDYTFTDPNTSNVMNRCFMFNKWKIKLGANYYRIKAGDNTWDTNSANRTFDRETTDYYNDSWVVAGEIKRHYFDKTVTLENFTTNTTSDLTITWYIPETIRATNDFNSNEAISSVEIVFEQMEAHYVSSNSTEFSIQKVLGETGSDVLRRKRYKANVKHGDGPSNFSVMSFRNPTNIKTGTWSTRGGSESLPGYKMLVIDPIFENLATLRQVFAGKLYGFLELHNTVFNIDSKVFAIKGYNHDLKNTSYDLKLHEIGTFVLPSITYFDQFSLSGNTDPTDSKDDIPDLPYLPEPGGETISTDLEITENEQLTGDNDPGTGGNYPL